MRERNVLQKVWSKLDKGKGCSKLPSYVNKIMEVRQIFHREICMCILPLSTLRPTELRKNKWGTGILRVLGLFILTGRIVRE